MPIPKHYVSALASGLYCRSHGIYRDEFYGWPMVRGRHWRVLNFVPVTKARVLSIFVRRQSDPQVDMLA